MNIIDIKWHTGTIKDILVRFKTKKLQIPFSATTMKITVRLDKRYCLANGKYPVKIAVARNGQTLYLPVNVEVSEKDWDAKARNMDYVQNLPNRRALNLHIRGELTKVEQKIRDLQLTGRLREFDNKRLMQYLSDEYSEEESNSRYFWYHAEKYISERNAENTKEAYEVSMKAFRRYYDWKSVLLKDMNKQMILDFKKHLEEEGLKKNTIETYVGHIRNIYKYCYENGYVEQPFPRIVSRRAPTAKRSLLVEQIRLLANSEVSKIQRKYIDVFMLILFMRGINMKDLSELPSDAVRNGRITYNRDKTGKAFEIKVEPEIKAILDKYKGKEHLLRFFDGKPAPFYKNFGNCMRQTIRTAATRLGIIEPLSAYWARHSWATLAIEVGGTMEMTTAGLGHSIGVQVTNVYVAFRQKQIDALARKVIDYIMQKGEYADK